MKQPNFKIVMKAERHASIEIYDALGPSWAGMIDASTVDAKLNGVGELDTIEVRINSPGGSAFEGLAIHNLLKDHPATVEVVVDGVAASAASLVAMAGDTVRIPKNARLMIHDPSMAVRGGERELTKALNQLATVREAAIDTYTAKSGKTKEEIAQWMSDETWFTGEEAVAAGFADRTEKSLPKDKAQLASQVQQLYQQASIDFDSVVALFAAPQLDEEPNMATAQSTPETPEVPAVPETPTAPQLTAADVKKAREEGAAEATKVAMEAERSRVSAINAVCSKAGRIELAQDFIEGGKTLEEVQAKMLEILCESNKPVGDAGGNDAPQNDEDKAYKAEFAKDKAAYMKAGLTEESYVQMRRIDDGKETLQPVA